MSATQERDQAMRLARTDAGLALAKARTVSDSWFRAQALSWVARFTDDAVELIAAEAAQAAAACVDDYGRSAVRAWEIAALAERGHPSSARKALAEAVATARRAQPTASRSEALLLLMEAAFLIDREAARTVSAELKECCPVDDHWRCERASNRARKMLEGTCERRKFFW